MIHLDAVVNDKGLADQKEFRFRLISRDIPSIPWAFPQRLTSNPSEKVTITDNPLLSAGGAVNGHSTHIGQAALKWTHISEATNYVVIYRLLEASTIDPDAKCGDLLGYRHSDPNWPSHQEWPYYTSCTDSRSTGKKTVTAPTTVNSVPVQTVLSPLVKGEIYAIRVNCDIGNGTVFSARDAYTWPSDDIPNGRIATFPSFGRHANKTFEYVICSSTFDDTRITEDEGAIWESLLQDAFEKWEKALNGFIRVNPKMGGRCPVVPANPSSPNYPSQMHHFLMADDDQNDIRMFDESGDKGILAFPELKADVFKICIAPPIGHPPAACVTSFRDYSGLDDKETARLRGEIDRNIQRYLDDEISYPALVGELLLALQGYLLFSGSGNFDDPIKGVDVSFRRQALPTRPQPPTSSGSSTEEVRFNTCLNAGTADPSDEAGSTFRPYALAVHEAGHALGLSGFSRLIWNQGYDVSHPTIPESVLNYDGEAENRARWMPQDYVEPDCSPHPFDVMAIYALYQSP